MLTDYKIILLFMNYTKKCQCEHTDYTITRWTIQFDFKYKLECTCGSLIKIATQEDVDIYNERYNKSMEYKKGTEWLGRKPIREKKDEIDPSNKVLEENSPTADEHLDKMDELEKNKNEESKKE